MKQDICYPKEKNKIKLNLKPLALTLILPIEAIVYSLKHHRAFRDIALVPPTCSASSSHLDNIAFSLHAFLKLSCRFSNRQIVV